MAFMSVRATIAWVSAQMSLWSLAACGLAIVCGPLAARPAADPQRAVGIVEQPCTATPAVIAATASAAAGTTAPAAAAATTPAGASAISTMSSGVSPPGEARELYERLLDPSARRDLEPPDPSMIATRWAAEEERLTSDWASLCRYRAENAALRRALSAPRVVFLGDSITELWKLAHPEFFADGFVDRGIAGQTTGQLLVRFRQDVIALHPAVVHIMGGIADVAGNGGPTSLDAIRNNIASMMDLATANDIRVVLASVTPAGSFPWHPGVADPAQHIVELNIALRRLARERNVVYVDYHDPLADERDAMKQTYSNDGVHPNRDGYSMMELIAHHALDQVLAGLSDSAQKTAPPAHAGKDKSGGTSH